jgi:uncharacterized protein (TIRG00374 family)
MRNRIQNILKVLISVTGVLIILLTQDVEQAVQLLQELRWLPFLAALLLFIGGVPLRAYRWGTLVWSLHVRVGWWRLVGLYFVGSFFNLFLPTGLGGDVVKMYELSRNDGKAAAAISSVLVERFLGLFILFAMASLALIGGYELVTPAVRILIAVAFAGTLIGVGLLLQRTWIESWGRRLRLDRLLGRFNILRELYESIHLYSKAALLRATATSVVFGFLLVLGYFLIGLAVGIDDLSLWYYFLLVPIISALLLIPSVGGLGIREGATVILFEKAGVDVTRALALALAYDMTLLVIALIGAVIYIIQGIREARR